MHLELLANELLLELFEYLDGVYLFRAFYNLNSRFNNLLLLHHRKFYFNFEHAAKEDVDQFCQHHLLSVINRIISIEIHDDLETPKLPELFLEYKLTLNKFPYLKSLLLWSNSSLVVLIELINQCQYFPNLIRLTITGYYTDKFSKLITNFLNNIWKLPKLIYCDLAGIYWIKNDLCEISNISVSIKDLSIGDGHIETFFHILEHTPNLRQLNITIQQYYEPSHLKTFISTLSSLKIFFTGTDTSLKSIFRCLPNLHSLTIETYSINWNGFKWEEILTTYFSQLKIFQCRIDYSNLNTEKSVDQLLDSFRTSFWLIQHQWYVGCQWGSNSITSTGKLYTLPYAFNYLYNNDEWFFKSTCPDEKNYYICHRVRRFTYSSKNELSDQFPLRFPNICDLFIELPFHSYSFTWFSSLNHLISLHLPIEKNFNYSYLQSLLDRATNLYLLELEFNCTSYEKLFQLKSSSVRRLELLSFGHNPCFSTIDCRKLVSSPFGLQCEVLSICIDNRMDVIYLLQKMIHLRSLRFQYKVEKKLCQESNFQIFSWLKKCLPPTYLFNECATNSRHIDIWIDRQTKKTSLLSETSSKASAFSKSFKRFFQRVNH